MPFKALFLGHAPDADPARHHSRIDTGLYQLHAVVVRDQAQGVEVCARMVREEGIHSILLCPGHSNLDVAEIARAAGPGVGVSVARGDGAGSALARAVMEREGWFSRPQP